MALNAGNIGASAGLAQRIYDNWNTNRQACGFSPDGSALSAGVQTMLKAQAYCIAQAVVAEIVANGEAFITTSKSALQREINNSGATVDTLAPSAERSIPLR